MNDFNIKQFLVENKMTRNSRLLNEEILDIDAELEQYFKDNPFTSDSPVTHYRTAADYVKQKAEDMGHVLTPAEKAKITKKAWVYQEEYFINRYTQQRDKEEREDEERKQNNLLPLVINDKAGTPDSKYYEYKNTYNQTRKGLPTLTHHHDPKSGYVTFQLKDKWKNTKFDQDTLDKYWAGT
jgi:hypothetical protein